MFRQTHSSCYPGARHGAGGSGPRSRGRRFRGPGMTRRSPRSRSRSRAPSSRRGTSAPTTTIGCGFVRSTRPIRCTRQAGSLPATSSGSHSRNPRSCSIPQSFRQSPTGSVPANWCSTRPSCLNASRRHPRGFRSSTRKAGYGSQPTGPSRTSATSSERKASSSSETSHAGNATRGSCLTAAC